MRHFRMIKPKTLRFYLFCACLLLGLAAKPYNIKHLSIDDGLSNSVILSLCFQSDGLLWIGTLDGLDAYDGSNIISTKTLPQFDVIPGNIIEIVQESDEDVLWVQTNYGITRIVPATGEADVFKQFRGADKLVITQGGIVFLLQENGVLSYFSESRSKEFEYLTTVDIDYSDIKYYTASEKALRLFTAKGIFDYPLTRTGGAVKLGKPYAVSGRSIKYAFENGSSVLAIDSDNKVLEYRPGDNIPVEYADLRNRIETRGTVSSMLTDNSGDIYISFFTSGVLKLVRQPDGKYIPEDLNLNFGVMCMARSPQNVICFGTDSHGIYTYSDSKYNLVALSFKDFDDLISHPVRAIYLDDHNNLWLGTKGDGMLLVTDFDVNDTSKRGNPQIFNSTNSALSANSVYSFSPSSRPIFWIGEDGGICYYSYTDSKIHRVSTGDIPLRWVSSVFEKGDSLYISTNGEGVFTALISGPESAPVLTDIKQYNIKGGKVSSNYFFTQTFDKSQPELFGNRGQGVFVISGDSLVRAIDFPEDMDVTADDIYAISRDSENIWLGTGNGLIKIASDGSIVEFGDKNTLLNSTIHALLNDDHNGLWLSTNHGLIRFEKGSDKTFVFSKNYGVPFTELCDGAAFRSDRSLFFGGNEGILILTRNENYRSGTKYYPEISILDLSVLGNNVSTAKYIVTDAKGQKILKLKSDETDFRISFMVPDFRLESQYRYYYSFDDGKWVDNGSDNTLNFTRFTHGKYKLQFKYEDLTTDVESEPYVLYIDLDAPCYATVYAKVAYLLIIATFVFGVFLLFIRRQRRKQKQALEALEAAHKEEVYEQKLSFFTNVTHEFCTPLTLIFGSCERLLSSGNPDENTRKYAGLIRMNTQRLDSLIQDLIDFRKFEGGVKVLKIIPVNISEMCEEVGELFKVIAEQNKVNFNIDIQQGIEFNTDYNAFGRILNNLLSNAFKYTHAGGEVRFAVAGEDSGLKLRIYNTGKGLTEEEKEKIFDHYRIFDNVGENASKGLSSRHGLGMAICHMLVTLLGGKITIESEPGKYAEFIVTLPQVKCSEFTETKDTPNQTDAQRVSEIIAQPVIDTQLIPEPDKGKNTILVVDDNLDILTLLSDSFSEYNVVTAKNADEGMEVLKDGKIDLIITDVMMPGTDGISFTRMIKGNKHTSHIPLVILSAKNTSDDKVEGLASGADAYVAKPFYMSYLRALVVRLLENRNVLKEYYNSSASAFEYSGGQLVDKESKEFINKIVDYIDENLDDAELSPETLAQHMQVSVRNLYRKFKELDLPSPNDFIKAHRISFAAKLLVTTSLTVQEIIYRSGFNNRSHFYREFDKVYGMTPKDYRIKNKGTATSTAD